MHTSNKTETIISNSQIIRMKFFKSCSVIRIFGLLKPKIKVNYMLEEMMKTYLRRDI